MSSRIWRVCLFLLLAVQINLNVVSADDRKLLGEECYKLIHDKEVPVDETKKQECLEKLKTKPQLVITPTRRVADIRQVPAAVSVVEGEKLERRATDSLTEAVRDVPGVTITDAGQAGQKRIRIRGEDSRRVAILIDGQEFADEREVGTPLLLAPEMVERVEVVRGTGSVLHGSRAIGGVINFITKKGGFHPLQGTVSSLYDSSTEGGQGFASIYGKVHDIEYRLAGTVADHNDRESAKGTVENTSFENDSKYLYLGNAFGENNVSAIYEDYNSNSDVYVDPVVATAPPFLDFQIDVPQRDREKFALFYDRENLTEVFQKVQLDFYFQDSDREFKTRSLTTVSNTPDSVRDSEIFTDSTLKTWGGNGQVDMQLGEFHNLIVGYEAKNDALDQGRSERVSLDGIPSPEKKVFDSADQGSVELFAEDEWKFIEDWTISAGARGFVVSTELDETTRPGLETSSETEEHIVGAAAIRYYGIDSTTIWAGWSQGYVYPTLINLATGAFAGPSFVNPNPDLDAETSNSFELGARVSRSLLSIETAVFFVKAEDYIEHVLCSATSAGCIQPPGTRDRVYVNVDEADTYGVEFQTELDLDPFTPYGSVTWLRRKYKTPEYETYDTGLPPVEGRMGLEINRELGAQASGFSDFYWRAATDSKELDGDEVIRKSGWGTLNLALGVKVGPKREYKFLIDLQNLGDKYYIPETENLPASGFGAVVKFIAEL